MFVKHYAYLDGNIRLTKVDAEYPDNKLTGATFEVYKNTNENGKIDDGDELIGNLEETETGIYETKELLYGKYIVRETKAPEGFLLDKGEYSVFIEKDETTYSVENKAGVGFINERLMFRTVDEMKNYQRAYLLSNSIGDL